MMDSLSIYLWIGLGSGLGGMGRFWLNGLVTGRVGETFPWATLLINVLGSFLIGLIGALAGPESRFFSSQRVVLFFVVGICGGFTTFSAFSIQTLHLIHDGAMGAALANILSSVILCLFAVSLGHAAGQAFSSS